MASGVELSTRVRVCGVKSNDFMPNEVVAGLEAGRDGVLVVGGGSHEGGLFLGVTVSYTPLA